MCRFCVQIARSIITAHVHCNISGERNIPTLVDQVLEGYSINAHRDQCIVRTALTIKSNVSPRVSTQTDGNHFHAAVRTGMCVSTILSHTSAWVMRAGSAYTWRAIKMLNKKPVQGR